MARIAIIIGQPKHNSFCEALGEAYKRGAEAGGHEVRRFVLANMSFDPILHEGFDKQQKLEPNLAEAQAAIVWAGAISLNHVSMTISVQNFRYPFCTGLSAAIAGNAEAWRSCRQFQWRSRTAMHRASGPRRELSLSERGE